MILNCKMHRLAATKREEAIPKPRVTESTESNTTNRSARATLSGVSSVDWDGWSCGARKAMVLFEERTDSVKESIVAMLVRDVTSDADEAANAGSSYSNVIAIPE